jgi:DeoR/GlpR family transcriptional regulator of sugar metabolism
MRYERLAAISNRHQRLMALIRQGSLSSPRLAVELHVSEQTVYRDILFLRHQGHAIKSVRLASSWAYQLTPAPTDAPRSGTRTR